MPNWCSNVVSITHTDPAQLERALHAYRAGALLQEFVPCPEELLHTESVSYPESDPRHAQQQIQEAKNVLEYGHRTWYDWRVANWGTKWDIGGEDCHGEIVGDVLQLNFDSAWSPPIDAYTKLEEQGFGIEAFYYEPGMAFCGSWINGLDDYYEIPETSAQAAAVIPEDIDLAFDIVNSMAMWEEEEAAEGE